MTSEEFWKLIELLDWDREGDDEAVVEPLVKTLSQMHEKEIFAFEEMLSEKLFQLDGKEYAAKRGLFGIKKKKEYLSADDFLYSRCVVIANGRQLFEEVIHKPNEFPHDLEFEMLLAVSQLAYMRKTGKIWDYVPKVSYETFSNKESWK